MRKYIKIKTSILLAAWSIIFLHAVIPHNHDTHHGASCAQLIHQSFISDKNDCDHNHGDISENESFHTASGDHEKQVCHFNANLHLQDNLDQFFISENGHRPSYTQIPVISVGIYLIIDSDSPPEYRLLPLRGPPSFA